MHNTPCIQYSFESFFRLTKNKYVLFRSFVFSTKTHSFCLFFLLLTHSPAGSGKKTILPPLLYAIIVPYSNKKESQVEIMLKEKRELCILWISFGAGLLFAILEFCFAIYSHSKSALTDAVYDASELVFIALILFLTPLFHKPISEKYPYGFYQVETIFLLIKNAMMLSVSFGISAQVIESLLAGGNMVNGREVSLFQLLLGLMSLVVFLIMKKLNHSLSSPTVDAEILGWRLDIAYSFGLSFAFFASLFLERTPLAFLAPYFDQIVAILVMLFMLPEVIRMLWHTIKELFLFAPDGEILHQIKDICGDILEKHQFYPLFFDIVKTGRHTWVEISFSIDGDSLPLQVLKSATEEVNLAVSQQIPDCTCELLVVPTKN